MALHAVSEVERLNTAKSNQRDLAKVRNSLELVCSHFSNLIQVFLSLIDVQAKPDEGKSSTERKY